MVDKDKKEKETKKGKDKPKKEETAMTVSEQSGSLSKPLVEMLTEDQKELIKRCFAKNATDDELTIYFNFCEKAGVDPLRGQSHFIKYKGNTKPIMMIGIDGFQARATSDPRYEGMVANVVYENDDFSMNPVEGTISHTFGVKVRGDIVGAYAILKRKGMTTAVQWVDFKEYYKNTDIWKEKPEVMITKVARATLLRREYPDNFSGIYVPEEFGSEITEKGDFVEHKKPEVKPFPEGQPMKEAEFTDEPEEEPEEPDPEDEDTDDEARTIPDDLVDDDMTPRDALKAIMGYAMDNDLGATVRPVIIKHYPEFEDGSRYPYHIPEAKVIKIVEELTGTKLKKAEKVKKCSNKDCGAKVTEPEAEEQQDEDEKPLCLKCWQKENE